MDLLIRQEEIKDHETVAEILCAAFKQPDESKLVELLRMDPAFIPELSLVAEVDGTVVGQILFTTIQIEEDGKSYPSLALAPVSIAPDYQGRGIGKKLISVGLKRARQLGGSSVIVLGDPHYYSKFGFSPASRWGIECPFPAPEEAFMALELEKGALSSARGTVRYASPFYQF